MDLSLRPELGKDYSSRSQRTRVFSEAWATENMYCPACDSETLSPERTGTKVVDFRCSSCVEKYQLKSQARRLGNQVRDAAYEPLAQEITSNSAPNFLFMHYDAREWQVRNLLLVPRHFLSLSTIMKQNPLRETAQRHGHILCNIILSRLPMDARIRIVSEGNVVPPDVVRNEWRRYRFLREERHGERGWTADVLACVRRIRRRVFTAKEFYAEFSRELANLHPDNRHVKDKIRQQLQVLRDKGILRFAERGTYRQIRWCPECGHDLILSVPTEGIRQPLSCPKCGVSLWA